MTPRMTPDQRRDALLVAAAETFAAAPGGDPTRVSVAEIAVRAGVSEPLVFRYFPTKAALHAAVVDGWARAQAQRVAAAIAAVPDGAPVRDRVRALLEVLLDDAARGELWWVDPGAFPAESLAAVAAARTAHGEMLRTLLPPRWRRHDVALAGWPGFVQAAVRAWVAQGCPADERGHVVDATLGALQGALGDWGA